MIMKKILAPALVAAVLAMTGVAAAEANWTAFAESTSTFQVVRTDATVTAEKGALSGVLAGDKIVAGNDIVRVRLSETAMLALDPQSESTVTAEAITLDKGAAAIGFDSTFTTPVVIGDLRIVPVHIDGDEVVSTSTENPYSGALVAAATGANQIDLASVGSRFAIRNVATGTNVALLGAGEQIKMLRDTLGNWNIVTGPSAQLEGEGGEDDGNERGGALLGGGAAVTTAAVGGVVVLGGAGLYLRERSNDEDDDFRKKRDEERENQPPPFNPPSSPIGGEF
jgi:hypothetical protein